MFQGKPILAAYSPKGQSLVVVTISLNMQFPPLIFVLSYLSQIWFTILQFNKVNQLFCYIRLNCKLSPLLIASNWYGFTEKFPPNVECSRHWSAVSYNHCTRNHTNVYVNMQQGKNDYVYLYIVEISIYYKDLFILDRRYLSKTI